MYFLAFFLQSVNWCKTPYNQYYLFNIWILPMCILYTVWIVYSATHLLLELTVWYLSGNSRLTAASTRLPHGKKNLCLTAACIRLSRGVLNACLIPIWKEPSDGRLHTAASQYIEQPPHSRLQTAAWQVKKHISRNSCLTGFSKRLSCSEFKQKLSGGWYDSGYVLLQEKTIGPYPLQAWLT